MADPQSASDPKAIGDAVAAAQKPTFDAILDELRGLKPAPAAAPAAAAPPPKKTWTRAELDAQVAAGRITADAADRVIEDQIVERAAERAAQQTAAQATTQTVEQKIARYLDLVPELKAQKGPAFERAAREYQSLVESGLPDSQATRLAALRTTFGTIDALAAAAGNDGRRETHQEGGGGAGAPAGDSTGEWTRGMNNRQKAHYRKLIDAGVYNEASAAAEFDRAQKRSPRA